MKKISLYHILMTACTLTLLLLLVGMFFGVEMIEKSIINQKIEERKETASLINEYLYSPATTYRSEIDSTKESAIIKADNVFIKGLASLEDVRYIKIVNKEGEVEVSSTEDNSGIEEDVLSMAKRVIETKKAEVQEKEIEGEKRKIIIYPGYKDRIILLSISIEKNIKEIQMWATTVYFVSSAVLLLIFTMFFLIINKFVLVPIKKISSEYEAVGRGDLDDVYLDIKGSKEMREISNAFNKMIAEIKDYQEEVKEQRNILEIKVNARTRELGEMNEKLEKDVKERTAELEKKLEENEKINKLMIGRELRMIELKEDLRRARERIDKLTKEKL